MLKKLMILFIFTCGFIILLLPLFERHPIKSVFHISEEPVAITRGTYGSVLTVNISFGDDEVKSWVEELNKPYPTLFIDTDWANRFPKTVEIIVNKNIPTALLGKDGEIYEYDTELFLKQLEEYESLFGAKPLWFRTADEFFPIILHEMLWEAEVNALGSTLTWQGGEIPPVTEGEIISVPHHRTSRVQLLELKRLSESREFHTIEDVIFGTTGKMKKLPK